MVRRGSSRHLLAFLLGLLVLTPTALAWRVTVDAPSDVGAGLPFLIDACAEGPPREPVQFKVAWLVDGRPAGQATQGHVVDGGHRYGPVLSLGEMGHACRSVRIDPPPGAAPARLEVKVRSEGGAARASIAVNVSVHDAPVARISGLASVELLDARLRVPIDAGVAFLPVIPSMVAMRVDGIDAELPPALAWRFVEARRGPLGGFLIENGGPVPSSLGSLALTHGNTRLALPDIIVEPGARVLVGPRNAPDVAPHVAMAVDAKPGSWRLVAAENEQAAIVVPALSIGEFVDENGKRGVQGRTESALLRQHVAGHLIAYTTPHAGASPLVEIIDGATSSIRGEFYTLTSPDIAHALAMAAARGVETTLLLEGAPAGGIPPQEEAIVAALVAHGVDISWLRSAPDFPTRYRTQHAKVLVIDDALVHLASENPTPTSYPPQGGARGTRGMGIIVSNATLAREVNGFLDADLAAWPDLEPARLDRLPPAAILARAALVAGPRLELEGAWNVTTIVSPDTSLADAEAGLLARLRNARATIDVAMLLADARFPEGANPFLDALVTAARDGASVRLLLDGRYERGEHAAIIERFQQLAEKEGLSLVARQATPDETLHAKWVGVDNATTYVGSMNWGHAAATKNREMGLLVENETLTQWYGAWFEEEWRKSEGRWAPDAPKEVSASGGLWVLVGLSFLLRRRATRGRIRRRKRT